MWILCFVDSEHKLNVNEILYGLLFCVVKRGQAKYCQVYLMSVSNVRYGNLKPGSYKTGHYAIPFCPSKSKQIFVRDLISLFFLTHENNEIKSPTKIYDFTVHSFPHFSPACSDI